MSNKQQNMKDKESKPCGVMCLPYMRGLSEKVKSILSSAGIEVAFEPNKYSVE